MKSLARIVYESSIRLGVSPSEVVGDGRHKSVTLVRAAIAYGVRNHAMPRPTFVEIGIALRNNPKAHASIFGLLQRPEVIGNTPEFLRALQVVLGVICEDPGKSGLTTDDFRDAMQMNRSRRPDQAFPAPANAQV